MTHASNPATAMVGERAVCSSRARWRQKTRGVSRASVALVATLALAGSAIAGWDVTEMPGTSRSPLVSLEEEATLRAF